MRGPWSACAAVGAADAGASIETLAFGELAGAATFDRIIGSLLKR